METNPAILAAREKLKAKFSDVRTGGKGTSRRKKRVVHVTGVNDEKKLQGYFKRIGAQPIPGIEEVNMFHNNGDVTHFKNPKFLAAIAANTFVISGPSETKPFQDMMMKDPRIIQHLGMENMEMLKKAAEKMGLGSAGSTEDDDVPDLVGDNFEEVSKH